MPKLMKFFLFLLLGFSIQNSIFSVDIESLLRKAEALEERIELEEEEERREKLLERQSDPLEKQFDEISAKKSAAIERGDEAQAEALRQQLINLDKQIDEIDEKQKAIDKEFEQKYEREKKEWEILKRKVAEVEEVEIEEEVEVEPEEVVEKEVEEEKIEEEVEEEPEEELEEEIEEEVEEEPEEEIEKDIEEKKLEEEEEEEIKELEEKEEPEEEPEEEVVEKEEEEVKIEAEVEGVPGIKIRTPPSQVKKEELSAAEELGLSEEEAESLGYEAAIAAPGVAAGVAPLYVPGVTPGVPGVTPVAVPGVTPGVPGVTPAAYTAPIQFTTEYVNILKLFQPSIVISRFTKMAQQISPVVLDDQVGDFLTAIMSIPAWVNQVAQGKRTALKKVMKGKVKKGVGLPTDTEEITKSQYLLKIAYANLLRAAIDNTRISAYDPLIIRSLEKSYMLHRPLNFKQDLKVTFQGFKKVGKTKIGAITLALPKIKAFLEKLTDFNISQKQAYNVLVRLNRGNKTVSNLDPGKPRTLALFKEWDEKVVKIVTGPKSPFILFAQETGLVAGPRSKKMKIILDRLSGFKLNAELNKVVKMPAKTSAAVKAKVEALTKIIEKFKAAPTVTTAVTKAVAPATKEKKPKKIKKKKIKKPKTKK